MKVDSATPERIQALLLEVTMMQEEMLDNKGKHNGKGSKSQLTPTDILKIRSMIKEKGINKD